MFFSSAAAARLQNRARATVVAAIAAAAAPKPGPELSILAALAPFLAGNVAVQTDPKVYSSDASLQKGAICFTKVELGWLGHSGSLPVRKAIIPGSTRLRGPRLLRMGLSPSWTPAFLTPQVPSPLSARSHSSLTSWTCSGVSALWPPM